MLSLSSRTCGLSSKQLSKRVRLLLVPVWNSAPDHWTLLVAQRDSPDQTSGLLWRRYDSLSAECKEAQPFQKRLGELLDPEFQLPPRCNSAFQPVGSNACGFFVAHWMEAEIRLRRGEWLSQWPQAGAKTMKARLVYLTERLSKSKEAHEEEVRSQLKKAEKERAQAEAALKKAQEKLSKLKELTSASAVTAEEQIKRNSAKFGWQQLSKEATQRGACSEDLQQVQVALRLLGLRPSEAPQV